uniref:Putative glycoside hydrolase family 114 protein n=1 Tax=Moniliophthora roreri TaxID=221103 RepID=A0A0W0GD17_MONRR
MAFKFALLLAFLSLSNATVVKRAVTPPPANAKFDYQIGGAYTPASDVAVVSRDRTDSPAAGKYNICYYFIHSPQLCNPDTL